MNAPRDPLADLLTAWEARAAQALPADAMLINRHVRELREAMASASEHGGGGGGEAGVCLWSTAYGDENDMWESSCGIAFVFNDGGPEDNSFRFCHGCGKRIEVASDQAIPPTPSAPVVDDGFEAWLDRDWPLWRNNEGHPILSRLRRCWTAALAGVSAPVGVEGWNIIPFTGSFKTSDERWEVYDPEGSGGAVNASDVRDPVVAKLLDALASRQAVQTNTSALLEEADSAVACSHNFATAKPDILPTEQEHILGLCRVVQKLRAALTPSSAPRGEEVQSRSRLRRIAAEKGEPAPRFDHIADADKKVAASEHGLADTLDAIADDTRAHSLNGEQHGALRKAAALIRRLAASGQGVDSTTAAVLAEVERAMRKFPTWPTDPLHAVGVVNEEVGELNKALLQAVYEPHKSTLDDVATEAIQAAAMTYRFVASLGRYQYTRCPQHDQSAAAIPKGGNA